MPTRLVSAVVDSADPSALGHWWARALGWTVTYESADEVDIAPAAEGEAGAGPSLELVFVPVSGSKVGVNQVHLDLAAPGPGDQDRLVAALVASGARRTDVGQPTDADFVVLADPEGNEFCVLGRHEVYADTGPIGAIVVNTADPVASGRFWSAATGWPVARSDERFVGLRAPDGTGPYLELIRSAGTGADARPKDRVHLDVAPFADDDQAAETARLVAAGARPVDVGQLGPDGARGPGVNWDVLAAPDGHEFCVLSPR